MGGYQYNNDILQFFPHAQGYVNHIVSEKDGGSLFDYVYQYKDHLGNIRINYTFDHQTSSLKVLEENHYYPFGLKHTNHTYSRKIIEEKKIVDGVEKWVMEIIQVPNNGYQYKYNSSEFQDELGLNMYAMDMRQYDPAIARWVVQDPVIHHNMSPYNAFDNNPVYWADPSGADSGDPGKGKGKGKQGVDGKNKPSIPNSLRYQQDTPPANQQSRPPVIEVDQFKNYTLVGSKTASEQLESAAAGAPLLMPSPASASPTSNMRVVYKNLDFKPSSGFGLLRGIGLAFFATVVHELFSSVHTPDLNGKPAFSTWGSPTNNVSDFGKDFRSKDSRDNHPGSYTIEFDNGMRYHGQGPISRAVRSASYLIAREAVFNDSKILVRSMDWTPSISRREGFKAEHTRMQKDKTDDHSQGYANPINYNIRQSPGYNYKLQDGQSVD